MPPLVVPFKSDDSAVMEGTKFLGKSYVELV